MNKVIVAVGSNINPHRNCYQASEILAQYHQIFDRSCFKLTAPVGNQNQPDFLNGAFYLKTQFDKPTFKKYLKQVEKSLGRVKSKTPSSACIIDLDIIVWNDWVVHDDFYSRDFVYQFVQELATRNQIDLQSEKLLIQV